MLAEVSGAVLAVRLDAVVVSVGGIGLLVRTTPATSAGLRRGATVRLATSLVVREDSLTLYGFGDDDARDVFEVLQTVSGVGPRLALAALAVLEPDDLRRAVLADDVHTLMRVPGIGRKGAQRIQLELGDRLGPPHGGDRAGGGRDTAEAEPGVREHVVAALVGLGWAQRQSEESVDAVLAADDATTATTATSANQATQATQGTPEPAEVLRLALRSLARP